MTAHKDAALVRLDPEQVLLALCISILLLLVCHVMFSYLAFITGNDNFFGILPVFDLREETNIPTLFSSVTMLISSALLMVIAAMHHNREEPKAAWVWLALIFLFLALDDTAMLHERLGSKVHEVFQTTGYLRYAWVIPYGIGVLIFVAAYARFLLRLPRNIMWLFILSGAVFVTGAIGMEMLSANINDYRDTRLMTFFLQETVEETLELMGVSMFIYSLLRYLQLKFPEISVGIAEQRAPEPVFDTGQVLPLDAYRSEN